MDRSTKIAQLRNERDALITRTSNLNHDFQAPQLSATSKYLIADLACYAYRRILKIEDQIAVLTARDASRLNRLIRKILRKE